MLTICLDHVHLLLLGSMMPGMQLSTAREVPTIKSHACKWMQALKESSAPVPKDLADMSAAFIAKCKAGTAQAHGSGYGGSGFKFDSTEDESQRAQRQVPGHCRAAAAPHMMPNAYACSCSCVLQVLKTS